MFFLKAMKERELEATISADEETDSCDDANITQIYYTLKSFQNINICRIVHLIFLSDRLKFKTCLLARPLKNP